VPRTLNHQVHQLKRDAFLDAAERLVVTKGYEQMTIQDVLDALETSRGALYHYFDSKQALLDAVVDRFADRALTAVEPLMADPNLPALRKLEQVFAGIARFKADQKELVLAILEVWNSDANALVRDKLRRLSAARLMPILSAVIEQGIREGSVDVEDPDEIARVLLYLMLGYQDFASEQFLARHTGLVTFAEVERSFDALPRAFERLLGVPRGSIRLGDEATLRFWFE
jgi:AcrR family transcriptional regulator